MATIEINDDIVRSWIQEIVRAAIAELDLPAIVKAAALEAVKRRTAVPLKPWYSAREVAAILGISVVALQARRLAGKIKGVREDGGRSYMFRRSEVERILGSSLADY